MTGFGGTGGRELRFRVDIYTAGSEFVDSQSLSIGELCRREIVPLELTIVILESIGNESFPGLDLHEAFVEVTSSRIASFCCLHYVSMDFFEGGIGAYSSNGGRTGEDNVR
jgi:hypothetical protein